jgi:hypothetical protein
MILSFCLASAWTLAAAFICGRYWSAARAERARVRRTMELQLTMGAFEMARVSAEDLYLQYRYGGYPAEMSDDGWNEIQAVPMANGELFRVRVRPVEPAERHVHYPIGGAR